MIGHTVEMNVAAELLHARIGLKPDHSFRPRLARALKDVADAHSLDQEALIARLLSDSTVLDALVDRVTVQETAFFRHPEQFQALTRVLAQHESAPLSAWSAASANGQEPYSLAMLLSEATRPGVAAPTVLATDISPAALQRTGDGRYSEREMTGVSTAARTQHFTMTASHEWKVKPQLRSVVKVRRYNLLAPIPDEVANCQIVMCRNVLIYFSQRHAESFLDRLADAMNPDAYLFVGGAETLWQMTERFDPIQLGACFAYRRRRPKRPRQVADTPRSVRAPSSEPTPAIRPRAPRPVPPASCTTPASPPFDTGASDSPNELELRGHAALAAGEVTDAIVGFRRWAYIAPDDPAAHFHLGSTLELAGEAVGARRAFRAALAALERCDEEQRARCLHGFDLGEFRTMLTNRCQPDTIAGSGQPSTEKTERTTVRT